MSDERSRWTPQAIVAVILALSVILMICGAMVARLFDFTPAPEMLKMWESTLGLLVGGLLAWIGTSPK